MRLGLLTSLSMLTTMSNAQNYPALEQIIAATWVPHHVTCKWEPMFGDQAALDKLKAVEVVGDLEDFANGLLTLTLKGLDEKDGEHRLTLKGRARIFGQAYSVATRVKIGEEIKLAMLTPLTCEWSNLRAMALLDAGAIIGKYAVRPLVPGRVILASDVRPKTLVRNGEPVIVYYEQGGVIVKVEGVAMKDGGVGETIPVRVPEVEKNRLEGVIQNDATLRWIP